MNGRSIELTLAVIALCSALAAGIVYLDGRVAVAASDTKAPVSKITDPVKGASIPASLVSYSIKGRADDGRGSGVRIVEVSTDGGVNWSVATDRSGNGSWKTWSYRWPLDFSGRYDLKSRARDNAGNVERPRSTVTVDVVR